MDLPAGIRDLIEHQSGAVSRRQLLDAGCTDEFIQWRLRSGRWQQPHRGTYITFSGPMPRPTQIWAAILRVDPDAVASHTTAAELDGLSDRTDDRVHVTAPVTCRVRCPIEDVVVHYAHRLPATRHPSKNPPRTRIDDTVLDLVDASPSARQVESWVTSACQKRLTTPTRLAAALARRKKISWRPLLEIMLADVAEGAQSPLELRYLRGVERAHDLPRGTRQRRWAGSRVIWIDVDYEPWRVRTELDGRVGHDDPAGRFRDRHRDNAATVGGMRSLRYGHADTFATACEVAAEVACVLRAQGWQGSPRGCGHGCPAPRLFHDHVRTPAA